MNVSQGSTVQEVLIFLSNVPRERTEMKLVANVVMLTTVTADPDGEIDLIMRRTGACRVQKVIIVPNNLNEVTFQMIMVYRVRQGPIVPRVRRPDRNPVQLDSIVPRRHTMSHTHAMQVTTVLKVVQI